MKISDICRGGGANSKKPPLKWGDSNLYVPRRKVIGGIGAILAVGQAPAIVKSMVGAKGIMSSGGSGWKNPYVTDGLIAMWDGEWNAGPGMHDGTITDWFDLTGNEHKLHAPSPSWAADGAVYSVTDNIFRASADEGEWFRTLLGTGRYSLEIVASGFNTIGCAFFCYRTRSDFYIRGSGKNATNTNVMFSSLGNEIYYTDLVNYAMELPRYVHVGCDVTTGKVMMNQSVTDITGNFAITPVKFQMALGATGELGDALKGQKYSRLAIYSRPLTAEEIAANYAIDKERFNLP